MASFLFGPPRDHRVDDATFWSNRFLYSSPEFEVGNEKLRERGACALGNSLSIDTKIQKLIIGPNRIGPQGSAGLADGIARNTGALSEFVILDGNDIGPQGCKEFVLAIKRNPRIRRFS